MILIKLKKAYKVIIKYLYHTFNTNEIVSQLTEMGYKVRNVMNGRQSNLQTKFFDEMEPASNNNEMYNTKQIYYNTKQISCNRTTQNECRVNTMHQIPKACAH